MENCGKIKEQEICKEDIRPESTEKRANMMEISCHSGLSQYNKNTPSCRQTVDYK